MADSVPGEIGAQVEQAVSVIRRHLAGHIRAVYLFGSAVEGGLKPHSDIDLMVAVDTAPSASTRNAFMAGLLAVSGKVGRGGPERPLEVTIVAQPEVLPWRHPARREMQFGEWLRDDLEQGRFEEPTADHDLAILLTQVRQHSICLAGPPANEFFDPVPPADLRQSLNETLAQWSTEDDVRGDERNIVLALARIWFTVVTGEIAPKDVAGRWALERLPIENRAVMATALLAYSSGETTDLDGRVKEVLALLAFCKSRIGKMRPAL